MTACLPLQPQSLSAAIADRLRQRILQAEWLPGADVHDGAVATSLGVSRTPVREAMKQLCHEGLLTALPRRGMTVTVLPPAHVQEAKHLRALLQSLLAQHPEWEGGLTQRMLAMAEQRVALSELPVTTPA
jgi:DNA-binding GntR family transcriptional regulator